MRRSRTRKFAFVRLCWLAFCLAFSLAACGQRGPLYLPDSVEESTATETGGTEEEKSDGKAEDSDETATRT